MIERNIPRDIEKYQSKFIGPFTKRQVLFGAPAIILAVGIYFLTRNYIGELSILLALLVGGPLMVCAVYRPYNIPFEKFAKMVLFTYLLSPKHRLFKCENAYDKAFESIKMDTVNALRKSKNKEDRAEAERLMRTPKQTKLKTRKPDYDKV